MALSKNPVVALGPEMPGWGSWQWIGLDLCQQLSQHFHTVTFSGADAPSCDVAIFIKHAPPVDLVRQLSPTAAVIYCPVDYYGSAAEIDADGTMLRHCRRVIVHSHRLQKY